MEYNNSSIRICLNIALKSTFVFDKGSVKIYHIIILRVSFCSDIWYRNILAYYLDN